MTIRKQHLDQVKAGISVLALFIGLGGCAGDSSRTSPTPEEFEEEAGTLDMPKWYIDREGSDETMVIYGYGSSPAEPDYPDNMRQTARRSASQEVAEQLEQSVRSLSNEYFDREDLGSGEDDERARQQIKQSVEQFVDANLVGVEYDKQTVSEDGRWFVRARYDLEQDFDAYLQALGVDPDAAEARDLRSSAEDYLEQMNKRAQDDGEPAQQDGERAQPNEERIQEGERARLEEERIQEGERARLEEERIQEGERAQPSEERIQEVEEPSSSP